MFYYHKGTQINKCTTTRVPNKTNILLPQEHPTKQMFYYEKGTQQVPQGYPTKQMFYW